MQIGALSHVFLPCGYFSCCKGPFMGSFNEQITDNYILIISKKDVKMHFIIEKMILFIISLAWHFCTFCWVVKKLKKLKKKFSAYKCRNVLVQSLLVMLASMLPVTVISARFPCQNCCKPSKAIYELSNKQITLKNIFSPCSRHKKSWTIIFIHHSLMLSETIILCFTNISLPLLWQVGDYCNNEIHFVMIVWQVLIDCWTCVHHVCMCTYDL